MGVSGRGALAALIALQALLAAVYAVALPTWRAPDEPAHYDMVLRAGETGGWPSAPGERQLNRRIEASYTPARLDLSNRGAEPPLAGAEAVPRAQRPAFDELAADVADGAGNGMFQHPPGYYTVAAVWRAALPGAAEAPYDAAVLAVRLLGALLAAGLPWLAWRAARQLGADVTGGLAAAALPVGLPQLAHLAGAVNNDVLLALLGGAVTVAALRLATGDLSWQATAAAGVLTGAALLTKGFALFALALVPAALVVGIRRAGIAVRVLATRLAAAGVLAVAGGGWWWLRNIALHGAVQPTGAVVPEAPDGFTPALSDWLLPAIGELGRTFWGQFGWRQAELPVPLVLAATAAVALGLTAAVAPRRAARRGELGLALAPLAVISAIVLVGAWGYHVRSGLLTPGLQGRYLLAGVVGLAAVCAVGWSRLAGRWAASAVLVGGLAVQVVALATVLTRFYGAGPEAGLTDRIDALARWAAPPPVVLAALGAATLLAAGLALAMLVVVSRSQRPAAATRAEPPVALEGSEAAYRV